MSTPKLMKQIGSTNMFECKVCGKLINGQVDTVGHYPRGTWQCPNHCRLPKPIDPQLLNI